MKGKKNTVNIPILARVEGEGSLNLTIKDNTIQDLQLKIFEPVRLFEKFLEGRHCHEVLDIVARICGICPVAYQMSATHALENIFNVTPSPWLHRMRRLFYCGEWLESHSMHIHLLATPDYFGFSSMMDMAKTYPEEVRRGLRLQNAGNALMRLFGKRSVHPVGACIGGFYKAPPLADIASVHTLLESACDDAKSLIEWVAQFDFPEHNQQYPCVSLRHPDEYPFNEGRIISDTGLDITAKNFLQHFEEKQVPHSNALHCTWHNKSYLVGPLARLNNNLEHLPHPVQQLLQTLPISLPSKNMFHSIIARAIEIYACLLEAIDILSHYTLPEKASMDITPQAGIGYGCTEAPRGLLWHRYETDEKGFIRSVRIIPPTSQNQARIEEDLKLSLEAYGLEHSEQKIKARSEMLIRNYDPCISCSTHFLTLDIKKI